MTLAALHGGHGLLFLIFIVFVSVSVAGFSDEDIIALHGNFLTTPEQLHSFKRRLRGYGRGGGGGGGGRGWGGGRGGGRGGGGGGRGGFQGDEHETIQFLVQNHQKIDRVTDLTVEYGVEANTTSEDADVSDGIKKHVEQMITLVQDGRRVRGWDPLFVEIFDNTGDITIELTDLTNGVQVKQSGSTPCAVELAKAHAQAVDGFVTGAIHNEHTVPDECQ